jgi:hypothetical protein
MSRRARRLTSLLARNRCCFLGLIKRHPSPCSRLTTNNRQLTKKKGPDQTVRAFLFLER